MCSTCMLNLHDRWKGEGLEREGGEEAWHHNNPVVYAGSVVNQVTGTDLDAIKGRLTTAESRISDTEDATAQLTSKVTDLETKVKSLTEKNEDLENHLIGLSENTEGKDAETFLERWLPDVLGAEIFPTPEHRGLLSVRYPMEHGIVKDWNDMERIWQYVYSKEQLQTFSEEHPVLLTEAPLNPSKNREKAAEIFFENFNVPALFISMQAVLSLGVRHRSHHRCRVGLGGRDVSRYLRLLLRKEGYNFNTSAEFEVVRTIKERACYLSLNLQKDETLETEKAQYVLPDGSTLNIGPARFRAPELLFRPDLIGDESSGIHEVLAYAIQKSDMDLRRTLYSTIVLCGGIKGFGERLLTEVKKLAPKDVKIKERLYSTWIGSRKLNELTGAAVTRLHRKKHHYYNDLPNSRFLKQVV
ncbi:beta-centractin-like [Dicentrarchus labrax]|uniref:beta-centractin-like n=1 Tax=Dicentrarchus labrax TaxID=13489 RepID=UPI0021F65EDA|nr:beta-centractin-like [Dicentrarchus labrax]